MSNGSYAFGDSDVAADRLRLLARLFAPEMEALLGGWTSRRIQTAVDLGCGPGHTTHLLGATLGPNTLIGIDGSTRYVTMADAAYGYEARFIEHDLASGVLPVRDVDVMFAHLLLAHLQSPLDAVAGWVQALATGGVLLLDEVETFETKNELLRDNMGLADHVVAARGATMNAGPIIAELELMPWPTVLSSTVVEHDVPVAEAVELFIMNFRTIRGDPSVREDPDALDGMAYGLRELRNAPTSERVVWRMRQVVVVGG
jgi:trans-aconitate 2-methyltransferase